MSEAATESALTYRGPDPKQLTSARLHRSTRRGLDAVVELWRIRAQSVGDDVDGIDLTYVMDALLSASVQSELKPFLDDDGKLPTSESAWEQVLSRVQKPKR